MILLAHADKTAKTKVDQRLIGRTTLVYFWLLFMNVKWIVKDFWCFPPCKKCQDAFVFSTTFEWQLYSKNWFLLQLLLEWFLLLPTRIDSNWIVKDYFCYHYFLNDSCCSPWVLIWVAPYYVNSAYFTYKRAIPFKLYL